MSTQKTYSWIASLYFFQSMPYVVVTLIAAIMYQQHGLSNGKITLITSVMMLPWAIKPVFAPLLENWITRKNMTLIAQFAMSCIFFLLALCVNHYYFIIISTLGLASLALLSSLHDIASDGVYLLNLDEHEQKKYVAVRAFFYQMGRLVIKGGLLVLAGYLALQWGMSSWCLLFMSLFIIGTVLTGFHFFNIPEKECKTAQTHNYFLIFKTLLSSWEIYPSLLFIFIYNFSEAQIQKIIPLFMLDKSGLNLSLASVSEIYGILGTLSLMLGIFISGFLLGRYSLSGCLRKLSLLTLVSHLLFFTGFGSHNSYLFYGIILFNQFTLGLANGAYMGYLLVVANRSPFPMSMYTLCTATMALSYVVFGSMSGVIEEHLGYLLFFLYIFFSNILLVIMTYRIMSKK